MENRLLFDYQKTIANLLGYGPLGFLLALSDLRSWPRWAMRPR